jgi:hypothetical protein
MNYLMVIAKERFVTATPNPLDLDNTVARGVLKRANTDVPPVAF